MRIRKIYLVLLVLWLVGCNDFLEQSSQDEIRPSMVTDLEQILVGDGYQKEEYNVYYLTEWLTDNIESKKPADNMMSDFEEKRWIFSWDAKMFDEDGGGYRAEVWENIYAHILGCNLVLDNLDNMKGNNELRENLRGEALTLRSWYYFHLVNLYGVAYNQGKPETDLGVPLKLDATVTGEFYARNTVKEVYDQIERDLLEGNRLLTTYPESRNFYRINHVAAKAMLSRMYLYTENWDKALAYADSVLAVKFELLDLNDSGSTLPYDLASCEVIWMRKLYAGCTSLSPFNPDPFAMSDELMTVYDEGADLRKTKYFLESWYYRGQGRGTYKGEYDYGSCQGIRTAELYLNRAEAYVRKYLKEGNDVYRQKALADLNTLRIYRLDRTGGSQETVITDGQELLEFCLRERRRELCGETCCRWGDVRRLGITVSHQLFNSSETSTLDMSDYVLPIPRQVLDQNPELIEN